MINEQRRFLTGSIYITETDIGHTACAIHIDYEASHVVTVLYTVYVRICSGIHPDTLPTLVIRN